MTKRAVHPRLTDIVEAIEHIHAAIENVSFEAFKNSWDKRWLVERGFEIISEASRHLPPELKARHPEIPWGKVAAIGNILRHEYQRVAPDVLWTAADENLPLLEKICRDELASDRGGEDKN